MSALHLVYQHWFLTFILLHAVGHVMVNIVKAHRGGK